MAWRFSVQNNTKGNPSWWLWAENNEKTAWAGETFDSLSNAKRACQNFKDHVVGWSYETYLDQSGQYRWRAKSANGAIVASAGEPFSSRDAAASAVARVRANASFADGP